MRRPRSAVALPLSHWRRAAPPGSTECGRRRFAIAHDEHATCGTRSAVALPSRAGGGQRRTAAPSATAGSARHSVWPHLMHHTINDRLIRTHQLQPQPQPPNGEPIPQPSQAAPISSAALVPPCPPPTPPLLHTPHTESSHPTGPTPLKFIQRCSLLCSRPLCCRLGTAAD